MFNEPELLIRIAHGDEQAFKEIHRHYWNEVYSLSLAFLKSHEAAEDNVQELFTKLWIKRASLPAVQNFRSFILVSTRNQLISALRKLQKLEKDESLFLITANGRSANSTTMEARETARLINEALSQLPAQQQEIFNLSRELGMEHAAIAEKLGLSKKTVSNTITMVLGHIRKYLYKRGHLDLNAALLLGLLHQS